MLRARQPSLGALSGSFELRDRSLDFYEGTLEICPYAAGFIRTTSEEYLRDGEDFIEYQLHRGVKSSRGSFEGVDVEYFVVDCHLYGCNIESVTRLIFSLIDKGIEEKGEVRGCGAGDLRRD